jgi:predicted aconitase with swiveling domain
VSTRVLVDGTARGEILHLDQPLSLWGGVDPVTGVIIEPSHPQSGESVAGRILVLPHGRGSSSSSSVLAELLRNGHGPAGIVLRSPDPILAIGALVARTIYDIACPVLVTDATIDDHGVWDIRSGGIEPVLGLEKTGQEADIED